MSGLVALSRDVTRPGDLSNLLNAPIDRFASDQVLLILLGIDLDAVEVAAGAVANDRAGRAGRLSGGEDLSAVLNRVEAAGGSDLAGEMGVATSIIGEGVEDRKAAGVQPDCEPGAGRRHR